MSEKIDLLIAEDDENDVFLLQRAFKESGETVRIAFVNDGQELIDALETRAKLPESRLPSLLVLDLKMPRRTGLDVLEWLRAQPVFGGIPALIFSSSLRDEDVERAYSLGASAFLTKPNSTEERVGVARFLASWVKLNRPPLASTAGIREAERMHAMLFPEKKLAP